MRRRNARVSLLWVAARGYWRLPILGMASDHRKELGPILSSTQETQNAYSKLSFCALIGM